MLFTLFYIVTTMWSVIGETEMFCKEIVFSEKFSKSNKQAV